MPTEYRRAGGPYQSRVLSRAAPPPPPSDTQLLSLEAARTVPPSTSPPPLSPNRISARSFLYKCIYVRRGCGYGSGRIHCGGVFKRKYFTMGYLIYSVFVLNKIILYIFSKKCSVSDSCFQFTRYIFFFWGGVILYLKFFSIGSIQ